MSNSRHTIRFRQDGSYQILNQQVRRSAFVRMIIVCALAVTVLSALLFRVMAGGGTLDSSFVVSGTTTTDFGANDEAFALAIQPDGKIVVAGRTRTNSDPSTDRIALARYNSDGTLDPSFGSGGKVIDTTASEAFAVALQPDGKILAAGFGANLTRFNSDGSRDTSFGSGGATTGVLVHPYTMLRQPDGKILVGGYLTVSYHNTDFAVGRYNSDGSVDTSFGSGGKVTTEFHNGHDEIHGLALQPDGKIVGVGQDTWGGTDYYAGLARYDSNGVQDASFGDAGKVTVDFSPGHGIKYHRLYAVAIQSDGKVLAAGTTKNYDSGDSFALARFNANGTPDSTFGSGGQVTTKIFGRDSRATALALQPNGKFLVVGSSNGAFALARYNSNGSLDTTFGPNNNGQVTTQIYVINDGASGIVLQPDGKMVLAGSAQMATTCCDADFALARYVNDLAPTAGSAVIVGRVTTPAGSPLSGVVMLLSGRQSRKTITDSNGNYRFANVETDGFYTVTPARANYAFTPANRAFSQVSSSTEAVFTGTLTGDIANPLDTPEYFVRQQYVDLLGREPDESGFNYWSDQLLACNGDGDCTRSRRTDVAAAFFIATEFQQTGSFIYNLYEGALNRRPQFSEYAMDRQQVVGGANLETKKQAFAENFVQRAEFVDQYQANATAESFVDALIVSLRQSSGVDLGSRRDHLIGRYNTGANQTESRSFVLRDMTEGAAVREVNYNAAFVLTEYFGYLRRDPDQGGYDFWMNVLNNGDAGNYRGMVCAFITSAEYQHRFSSVATHSNLDCVR